MPTKAIYRFDDELTLEKRLRRSKFLIPLATSITAAILYGCIIWFESLFSSGHYWVVLFAGMTGHAFFIVLIHDAAHHSITRSKADRYLMTFGSGLMLLPFYGELFRKYHLIHHSIPNAEHDPLWPESKTQLYAKNRLLYVLCSLVPLLFTLYLLIISGKGQKSTTAKAIKGPKVNVVYIMLACVVTAAVILIWKPNVWYCIGTLFFMNMFSVFRHWCEHMGYSKSIESNTFNFPLGMGIGNHDAHHHHPGLSWLTLMLALPRRTKTTTLWTAVKGVLLKPEFSHFKALKNHLS